MSHSSAIDRLLDHLRESLRDDTFVSLRLSGASAPEGSIQGADIRLIDLKGTPRLSITTHEAKRDTVINMPVEDGIRSVDERLAGEFRNAMLRTTRLDWQFHRPEKGQPRLISHEAGVTATPAREHDRPKDRLLDDRANDWLQALDVLNPNGRVRASMADKHRQITRYVEILHHLARDCGWTSQEPSESSLLKVADMGCGKGYLTFAAWHLFRRILHRPVSIIGVETRGPLVIGANSVAGRVKADGLEFVQADIASAQLPHLDALIALHACNTATDDAILRGIELGAKLIVVAPCCHQALRPQLGNPRPLDPLLRHGLFKERMAEWLTDGLRTLFLEWAGYQTKVIEFVGSEHTPKNLMIAATRKQAPFKDDAARERIVELKHFFEIKHHALDVLLR